MFGLFDRILNTPNANQFREEQNYQKHGLLYNNTFYWDLDSIEYDYGISDRELPGNWKGNVIEVYSIK